MRGRRPHQKKIVAVYLCSTLGMMWAVFLCTFNSLLHNRLKINALNWPRWIRKIAKIEWQQIENEKCAWSNKKLSIGFFCWFVCLWLTRWLNWLSWIYKTIKSGGKNHTHTYAIFIHFKVRICGTFVRNVAAFIVRLLFSFVSW